MVSSASAFAFLSLAEGSSLYSAHQGSHCYAGHGGVPLDDADTVIQNVTTRECEAVCDSTTNCIAVTTHSASSRHNTVPGDCYLRSDIDLEKCDTESQWWRSKWSTNRKEEPPPLKRNLAYHLFESKYTGLENKNAGDFKGDASFIFSCFTEFNATNNPEASMDHNIIEMTEVNVTGWGMYEKCNAPGADNRHHCPADGGDYCCTIDGPHGEDIRTNHTTTQLPGLEFSTHKLRGGSGGFWYSFPRESQGVTWNQKLLRRIAGKCLGDAWRTDAGGCDSCGEALDSCVAKCIQNALIVDNNITLLEATWDRVFADPNECPDVPTTSSVISV